jgi:hypothetical protein
MLTLAFALLAQVAPASGAAVQIAAASISAAPRLAAAAPWPAVRRIPALLIAECPVPGAECRASGDTLKRRLPQLVEYSELYGVRHDIHRVLGYAMIPLFVGSAYTGFELRNKGAEAAQWTRDLHGPLAAGTAIVFGMNALTGVWNLIEGRKDPEGRAKRLLHGALFLAAGAGFAYVTAAGDNIHSSGRPNHWHRDVALGSMAVSVVSWSMMALFR